MSCCATVLSGTKRMLGRCTASQIASASLPSFLLPRTKGFTNCGLMIRTTCPARSNSLAQWKALAQASMPIVQRGSAATKGRS
jgi:hypothetical protein